MKAKIQNIISTVADSLFPVLCLSCGKELGSPYVCSCPVSRLSGSLCPVCDRRIPNGEICVGCRTKTKLKRFFVSSKYQEKFPRELLHAIKYDFATVHKHSVGHAIKRTLLQCHIPTIVSENPNHYIVIPVPLSNKKLHARGFNQSEIFAQEIASFLKIPLDSNYLTRTKNVIPQSSISTPEEKKRNVAGIFSTNDTDTISGKIIFLVDDVYTSGATMEECARVLKEYGAKEIWGVVFAKG